MKSRLIVAAICVPVLFVILFFLPPWGTAIITAGICAMAAWELLSGTNLVSHIRLKIYTAVLAAAMPIGVCFGAGGWVMPAAAFLLMALLFAEAVYAYEHEHILGFTTIAAAMFAGAVMPWLLTSIVSLRVLYRGHLLVLLPIMVAFVADGGAYFAGVFLGKHKAFPHVSPKKTIEGCVGGLVAGVVIMLIYGLILMLCKIHVNFLAMAVYGLIGSVVTILGDLAFSLVKREYEIKDYGKLLKEHGGILDRFDSMYFAAPVIYVLVQVLPAF